MKKALLILLIALTGFIVFYNLGHAPLENWDEAWYADITRNMIQNKNLFIPYWNMEPLNDKPPLYMWLSIVPVIATNYQELGYRLISAISGFLTIILIVYYAYKKWGLIPSLLTFTSLTLNSLYIWRVRSGNLDSLFTLLVVLTFFVLISKLKYRYILLGVLLGLLFLTKASLAFIPMSIVALYEFVYVLLPSKNSVNVIKKISIIFIVFLILTGIWLVPGYLFSGKELIYYYIFNSDQGIIGSIGLANFNTNYVLHTYYALQRAYFLVFIFGSLALLYNYKKANNLVLLALSYVMVFLLSFIEKNNNWYLVPSMPFWSLTIGYGTYICLKISKKISPLAYKASIIVILTLTIFVSQKTFRENIIPIFNSSSTQNQKQSGLTIKNISNKSDVVVRLDHLYPTTVYYSERRVFASPNDLIDENLKDGSIFIGRNQLVQAIKENKINLVIGSSSEIDNFLDTSQLNAKKRVNINNSETILVF